MRCVPVAASARAALAFAVAVAIALPAAGCGKKRKKADDDWTPPSPVVPAAASVWIVDDSVRIGRRDRPRPIMAGEGNPVWSPDGTVALFGLPGETVALQVGITAGPQQLAGVVVELDELAGPSVIANAGALTWQPIERFVVHDLTIERRSGGKAHGESLGWYTGAHPPDQGNRGSVPDPLIPIAIAPTWADYPMTVARGEHRIVWIDVTLADDLAAGTYRGTIRVAAGDRALASIPVELQVAFAIRRRGDDAVSRCRHRA